LNFPIDAEMSSVDRLQKRPERSRSRVTDTALLISISASGNHFSADVQSLAEFERH